MVDNDCGKKVCGICFKKLRKWKPLSEGSLRKDWTGRKHHLSCWKMLQTFRQVFGYEYPFNYELAKSLGEALQLTNILRDVHEDYSRGNIYLPNILLNKHGMNANETVIDYNHPAVGATCKAVAEIARDRFTESANILANCEPEKIRPARIMMTLYQRLFEKLCHRGWNDLTSKVGLSKWEKVYLIIRSTYFK